MCIHWYNDGTVEDDRCRMISGSCLCERRNRDVIHSSIVITEVVIDKKVAVWNHWLRILFCVLNNSPGGNKKVWFVDEAPAVVQRCALFSLMEGPEQLSHP